MTIKTTAFIIILLLITVQGVAFGIQIYLSRNLYRWRREEEAWLRCICTPPLYSEDDVERCMANHQLSVERYMANHRFSEEDKKKVRDFLNQKQAERASLESTYLHYVRGDGEYLVSYSALGIRHYG